MKRTINQLIFVGLLFSMCESPTPIDNNYSLGLTVENGYATMIVWSPTARKMRITLYKEGVLGEPVKYINMVKSTEDLWSGQIESLFFGYFYTIQMFDGTKWLSETVDPYVKLVGVNGVRGYIGDPSEANPERWDEDTRLEGSSVDNAVIYEVQIRDFSFDSSAGSRYPGKYLAFTENNISYDKIPIGIAHLKELGITHLHLLPTFDFRSIDESRLEDNEYNWGYDPLNYNVPEGSFSTDPFDPYVRVNEFKQMVMALHEAGIAVVMDVVYNHTGLTSASNFNLTAPNAYYRMNEDGSFSNASACGNETASEKPMMRRFMIESMTYWMEEYHIDGFRVDLMGIHDIETMNLISRELKSIHPNALLYGEGWAAGASPLPEERRAVKQNASQLESFAVFSDEMRDGMKGHWTNKEEKGFISGKEGTKESVKFGIVGGVQHPQVDYLNVNYTDSPWADHPLKTVNYISCHDGMTLYDKLMASMPDASEESRKKVHLLANTIVLTSQGISFLHAGVDFMRTKKGVDNSYESPDSINAIDWSLKSKNKDVFDYYRQLIALRKSHPAFRRTTAEQVRSGLQFLAVEDPLLIAYTLEGKTVGDSWSEILVAFNGNLEARKIELPGEEWRVYLLNRKFEEGNDVISGKVELEGSSAMILYRQQ